jgi:hypothetical protein
MARRSHQVPQLRKGSHSLSEGRDVAIVCPIEFSSTSDWRAPRGSTGFNPRHALGASGEKQNMLCHSVVLSQDPTYGFFVTADKVSMHTHAWVVWPRAAGLSISILVTPLCLDIPDTFNYIR